MGRRSGGGGGFKFSSSSGGAAPAPPPAPVQSQSQPAAGGQLVPHLPMVRMVFGSGNAVGHRVTDAVLGPRVFKHEVQVADPAPSAASCAASMTAFQACFNVNGGDLSKCQFYMNMVCECRRSSTILA
ncbi:hypothetical protein MTR67_020554 [Solanum verrucosum]|uniref:CHCH domain-containing protein n=1 Tax=Solanum verrucosum TaxID=315347 RepID=A0AAF0QWE2_SOLVR|nr:hypothetical protein MTR67_020554 [Solanum verrucosum]